MGNPDFDSLSGMQIDTNTTEFTLKRAGKPVGTIRRTVSKDGQNTHDELRDNECEWRAVIGTHGVR